MTYQNTINAINKIEGTTLTRSIMSFHNLKFMCLSDASLYKQSDFLLTSYFRSRDCITA